jgi:hypothetical protein
MRFPAMDIVYEVGDGNAGQTCHLLARDITVNGEFLEIECTECHKQVERISIKKVSRISVME